MRSSTIRRRIRTARATCRARCSCAAPSARSVGERVEIVFDGFRMGSFDGGLAYTFYPGSRLIQQEAVLTTNDADVAYYYDAGLEMAAPADRQPGNNMRTEVAFYDTEGALRRDDVERSAGRTRPGAGALSHAGAEDGGRKRGGVPGAAPATSSRATSRRIWATSGIGPGAGASRSASGNCATRTGSTTRG